MGREIKRVALDFDFPLGETWIGYLQENYIDGSGENYEPPAGEGWQVRQTVTEGGPITPVFPTKEALAEHMTTDAYRRGASEPFPDVASALRFIEDGWAPSFMFIPGRGFGTGESFA